MDTGPRPSSPSPSLPSPFSRASLHRGLAFSLLPMGSVERDAGSKGSQHLAQLDWAAPRPWHLLKSNPYLMRPDAWGCDDRTQEGQGAS